MKFPLSPLVSRKTTKSRSQVDHKQIYTRKLQPYFDLFDNDFTIDRFQKKKMFVCIHFHFTIQTFCVFHFIDFLTISLHK